MWTTLFIHGITLAITLAITLFGWVTQIILQLVQDSCKILKSTSGYIILWTVQKRWSSAVHMANAELGCKMAMGGTNSCPGCMNKLRKHYPDLVGGSFLANHECWLFKRVSMIKGHKSVCFAWKCTWVSLVPRLPRSGMWIHICRESLVSFLMWAWHNHNRTQSSLNRKATFCTLFNQLCVQRIFAPNMCSKLPAICILFSCSEISGIPMHRSLCPLLPLMVFTWEKIPGSPRLHNFNVRIPGVRKPGNEATLGFSFGVWAQTKMVC